MDIDGAAGRGRPDVDGVGRAIGSEGVGKPSRAPMTWA